jgi:hypothetical protein
MDAATLQAKTYAGYANVARIMGVSYQLWRPGEAHNPFTNQIATLLASFNGEDMAYSKPTKYGKATWYGVFDGRLSLPGDYLVRSGGDIYFVAAQQLHLPILAVLCNRLVRIQRPAPAPATLGAQPYKGVVTTVPAKMADVLGSAGAGVLDNNFILNQSSLGAGTSTLGLGWPCSLLRGRGGSGQGQPDRLADSVSQAGWDILLPVSAPLVVKPSDIVLDDLGKRYQVGSAELTDLGWRVSVMEVHT